jgi:hypothetical protein
MGNNNTINKCNFEDIQNNLNNFKNKNSILINTLNNNQQSCLIPYTMDPINEEKTINHFLSSNSSINIFIYGKNCNDHTIYTKYNQLTNLGFSNIYLYIGGLFEWLCLQDIYDDELFPTTKKELDILKFKPNSFLDKQLFITS